MTQPTIEADYLVVGTGAVAMAFVDTLLDGPDATVVMVDRHAQPGGHWNEAYPFVRLHQPSAWYGVASRAVAESVPDGSGFDRGASGADVLDYFGRLMRERFLPSGRVRWFPRSEYRRGEDGSHRIVSLADGSERSVTIRRKRVDATHARTPVPSTHLPRYEVAPGVRCISPHQLPQAAGASARYTVVGSGKTGMDSVLWLLAQGVRPERIRWIMPRDAWLQDRAGILTGAAHFERSMRATISQFEAIAESHSVPELLSRLEERGVLLRLDRSVQPGTYRCAIVSQAEMAQLRRIGDVVRLGHVRSIHPTRLVLEHGTVEAGADTLYVDCSASALQRPPALPVFDGDVINLLMISWCRPTFSAALIAHIENTLADEAEKNALCTPAPTPERPADWLLLWAVGLQNAQRWARHPLVNPWLKASRLNSTSVLMNGVRPVEPAHLALVRDSAAKAQAAAANLPRLLRAMEADNDSGRPTADGRPPCRRVPVSAPPARRASPEHPGRP